MTCTGSGGYWVDMEDTWGGKHTQFYDCEKCGESHARPTEGRTERDAIRAALRRLLHGRTHG